MVPGSSRRALVEPGHIEGSAGAMGGVDAPIELPQRITQAPVRGSEDEFHNEYPETNTRLMVVRRRDSGDPVEPRGKAAWMFESMTWWLGAVIMLEP